MSSQSSSQGNCFAEVTENELDIQQYIDGVADPGAGAIASFLGVTRNSFQGKAVEKLEYEAYVPMALKKIMVSIKLLSNRFVTSLCFRPVPGGLHPGGLMWPQIDGRSTV